MAHFPQEPGQGKELPSFFMQNKGQWDKKILFKAEIPQGQVFITNTGISYKLKSDIPASSEDSALIHLGAHGNPNVKLKGHLIRVSFEGALPVFQVQPGHAEPARFHFMKGKYNRINDVRAYKEVRLQNVYDGIDLVLYFHKHTLKYDFIVKPGKKASSIKLLYEGVDSLYKENEHLVIATSLGKIYEKPPITYQLKGKNKRMIPCKFDVKGRNVSFYVSEQYDKKSPLIIDPELIFSTYSGSFADNFGNTATYDEEGNMYTGGIIYDDSFLPVTPGPLDSFHGVADGRYNIDCFIMKYNAKGTSLLQAVYLGGNGNEFPTSMIVNKKKELVVLGTTGSLDFPVTSSAFDTTFNGGDFFDPFYNLRGTILQNQVYSQYFRFGSDIYVTKLDAATFNLVSSTYLGGTGNDGIQISKTPCVKNYGDQLRGEIMTDKDDNVYIASQTYSSSITGVPVSSAHHTNSGNQDALVVKFTADLSAVSWMRMVGGKGFDSGLGIRVDSLAQVYVTGGTTSTDFISETVSGYQKSHKGDVDGYIVKIARDGNSVIGNTYLGTSAYDQSYFIDLDSDLNVYVTGQTSGSYPVSPGVYSNPNSGQFIHKFSNDLSVSLVSTVFGSGSGSPDISLTAFLVNNCRKIFVSGWGGKTNQPTTRLGYSVNGTSRVFNYSNGYIGGNTGNMPVTKDAFQPVSNGNSFYFIIFHPEMKTLAYATQFGGMDDENQEHVDGGTSRFDKKGVIYQSVCAGCNGFSNFPTPINGVWSMTNNSDNCNNASLKFDLGKVVAEFETIDSLKNVTSVYGCAPITFFIKNRSSGATNYKWDIGDGIMTEKNDSIFVKFTTRGLRHLTLIAFDTSICRLVDTARALINAGDVRADFPKDRTVCDTIPYEAKINLYTPWAKVNWSPVTGLSDPTSSHPIINVTKDIRYIITVNDDTLCTKTDTLDLKVRNTDPKARFVILNTDKTAEKYRYCFPAEGYFRSLSTGYDSLIWKENNQVINTLDSSFFYAFPFLGHTSYSLTALDTVCHTFSEAERIVLVSRPLVNFPGNVQVCPDSSVTVSIEGESTYQYRWRPHSLFKDTTLQQQIIYPAGNGTVSMFVSDSLGCADSSSFTFGVYANTSNPVPEEKAKICPKKVPSITVSAVEGLQEYFWKPYKETTPGILISQPGMYYFSGTTKEGCPVRDTVHVIQHCDPELHVPTAFTPDGDGKNDFFEVFGHEVTSFDIKIFSRWGELIYTSTNFRFNWDGTYKGQTVPIGTYPYIIHYGGETFEGEQIARVLSGDVTVVR